MHFVYSSKSSIKCLSSDCCKFQGLEVICFYLIKYISDGLFGKKFTLTPHKLIKIFFHIFKYKVECIIFSNDFSQLY